MASIADMIFQGERISTWRDPATGTVYCAPRELCELLGVDWSAQRRKLLRSALYQRHMIPGYMLTGAAEMLLLDIDYLPFWLFSISAAKVKPDIRETLIAYQQESL